MEVKLANTDYVALIDEEDWELVSRYSWSLSTDKKYAINGGNNLLMHRLILGITDSRIKVDHQNGDGFNNHKYNLRIATDSQNGANQTKAKSNTSGFKGVSFDKISGKWYSHIRYNYKKYHLGCFKTKAEAAAAYNKKAIELFGDFAKLNQI